MIKNSFIRTALVVVAGLTVGTPLRAQTPPADSTQTMGMPMRGMMRMSGGLQRCAMMATAGGAADVALDHRDSLRLTDQQVRQLTALRDSVAEARARAAAAVERVLTPEQRQQLRRVTQDTGMGMGAGKHMGMMMNMMNMMRGMGGGGTDSTGTACPMMHGGMMSEPMRRMPKKGAAPPDTQQVRHR